MNPQDDNKQGQPDYQPKTIFSDPQAQPQQTVVYNAVPEPVLPNGTKAPSSKKGLIIAIISGVGALFIIALVVIVLASADNSKSKNQDDSATSTQAPILQPAQAIEMEQTNNSINQDLSGLDDEKDFPANSLEDKTLGL